MRTSSRKLGSFGSRSAGDFDPLSQTSMSAVSDVSGMGWSGKVGSVACEVSGMRVMLDMNRGYNNAHYHMGNEGKINVPNGSGRSRIIYIASTSTSIYILIANVDIIY